MSKIPNIFAGTQITFHRLIAHPTIFGKVSVNPGLS
jgi:hypothetical protein